jgi:hypothetical protein
MDYAESLATGKGEHLTTSAPENVFLVETAWATSDHHKRHLLFFV